MSQEPLRLPPREAYRRWAVNYAQTSVNPLTAAVDRAASRVLPDVRDLLVLDVGCGTGRWSARLESAGARVIGLDPVLDMLRERAGAGAAVTGDAVAIPLAGQSIDAAVCVLSLSHVHEPGAVLAELDRVLVRGGWALIADVHAAGYERGWMRTFRDSEGQLCEVEWTAHSVAALRTVAPRAGLAIEAHTEEHLRYDDLPEALRGEATAPAAYAVLARKR
jgi:ubiquinone/menaquinone biosynthesis C-methylase UbiE